MQKSLFSPETHNARSAKDTFRPPFYIGTGGWNCRDWVGPFYPPYLDNADWLAHYATQFPTVEIDSTFYGIPRESTVRNWYRRTPDNFIFTVKMPRQVSHEQTLRDVEPILDTFLARIALLKQKLGPILIQFPPGFTPEYFQRLHDFIPLLPTNFRFAIEIRHPGWLTQPFFDMLAANNIALTLTDSPYIPKKSELTADFTYIRWIGNQQNGFKFFGKTQTDRSRDLSEWATVMAKKFAPKNIEVFGYFNNHYAGFSPDSVEQLYRIYRDIDTP